MATGLSTEIIMCLFSREIHVLFRGDLVDRLN